LARQRGDDVPSQYEVKILTKTGEVRWVEVNAYSITHNGQPAVAGTLFDITDRKQVANKVSQSEEQYRLLADNVHDVIWTMDLQGHFTYVSPSVYRLRGFIVEEVLHQSLAEMLCQGSVHYLVEGLARITQALQRGLPFPDNVFELEQPCKDGSTIWTEATITGLYNDQRELVGILGVTRDISIQKKIRDALAESEDRLSFVMQATNDGLWDWWPQSGKTYFSPQYYYLLGYEMDEFPASLANFRSLIHPEDLPMVDARLAETLAAGEGFDIELRLRTKDSKWKWILDRGRIKERDASGKPLRLVGTHIDISARKLAEQQLAESELQLRTILHNVPGFIFQLKQDFDGRFRFCYAGEAVAMFGITPADLIADSGVFLKLVYESDLDGLKDCIKDAVRQGTSWHQQIRMYRPDRTLIWMDVNAVIQPAPDGGIIWTGFMVDINDRVLLETEMLHAMQEADKANALKSEFLANMSHEIRTPMNAIIGFANLMSETMLDSKQQDYLAKIRVASDSLLFLINDILDVSKIEAGKMELESGSFSLAAVVEKVRAILGERATQKKLGFHLFVDPNVPDRLTGDCYRLEQILLNLVSNAVKFTERGAVIIRIDAAGNFDQIEHTNQGNQIDQGAATTSVRLRFSVEDTGIGISEDQQRKLFQPFSQADGSTTRRYGGSGLGLVIARTLVELMGGKLLLASVPGRGSCFSFCVMFTLEPVLAELRLETLPEDHGSGLSAGSIDSSTVDFSPYRILVVEDNDFNRQLAKELLTRQGAVVDTAENGAQAVDMVERSLQSGARYYSAVLMDVQMPVMDGFEASRMLRRNPTLASLPIIALTARAVSGDRAKCLEAGMNDFITKPINQDVLFSVLAHWLGMGEAVPGTIAAGRTQTGLSPSDLAKPGQASPESALDTRTAIEWLGNSAELYHKVINIFLERYGEEVAELQRFFAAGDSARLRRLAHSLKSEAGTLGAAKLAELAEQVETAAAKKLPAKSLLKALLREIQHTVGLLEQYLRSVAL